MNEKTYPEHIMNAVREMTDNCESDEAIMRMSKNQIFSHVLRYEGIIGYEEWIRSRVKSIYGVDLSSL